MLWRIRAGYERPVWAAWFVVLVLAPAVAALAQPATTPPASSPPAATPQTGTQPAPAQPPVTQPPTAESPAASPPITVEEIQQRLKEVENLKDLDDDAKTKVREAYQKALQDLTEAQGFAARGNSFAKMASSVEEQLRAVNFQLSAATNNITIEVPPDATVQKLIQLAEEANAEVVAAQRRKNELEAEPGRRQQRRVEVPKAQQDVRRKEQELADQLTTISADTPLGEAQKARLKARQIAVAREKEMYERELNAYVATAELLPLERELANRQLSLAEKRLAKWRELVDARRRAEASEKAEAARLENAMASPALQPMAARNQELAERSQRLVIKIQDIAAELDATEKLFAKIEGQFKSTKAKVDQVGLTNAIGLLLRQQNARLPDVRQYRVNSQQHIEEIRATQLELIELEEERGSLFDIDRTEAIIAEIADSDSGLLPTELEGAVTDLLEKQKEHFGTLLQNENTYFGRLVDLENAEAQLIKIVAEYDNYIGERILWVRSSGTISVDDIRRSGGALAWFLDRENWTQVAKQSRTDARKHMFLYIAALLSFGLLLAFQQHLRRLISNLGEQASKGNCESYSVTAIALMWTLIVSAVWPLLLLTVAWRLTSVSRATDFSKFLGAGLAVSAVYYFCLEFLRQVCRHRGLAHAHFEWPHGVRGSLRRNLRWFMLATMPLVFVAAVFYADASSRWYDSLPRFLLITLLVLTAVLTHLVLRPGSQLFRAYSVASVDSRFYRLRYVWYVLVMSFPLSLALLAVFGFHYTAHRLTVRLQQSIWWLQLLLIVWAMALRWLFLMRRRLAIAIAKERRAALQNQTSDSPSPSAGITTCDPGTDLVASSKQSRQLLQAVLLATAIFGLWLIWVEVIPALGFLDRVVMWQVLVDGQTLDISLSQLFVGIVIIAITLLATKNIPGLLELVVLSRLPLDAGTRYAIITICRYVIAIVGAVCAFNAIGVPWSKYQWLVAAVTVGLGFGLQEIFGNFVSGLIVLLERPIRVGDVVTIDNVTGTVSKIRMRATTVTNWDRQELIVPNKEFVTGRLLNWTLSNAINRVVIKVGVAYGSDTELAKDLLLKAATDTQYIMADPPPVATFEQFGDSTLDMTLRCYLPNMDNRLETIHLLHSAIHREFAKAGLEIAFPQRDIHIRTSVQPVVPDMQKRGESLPHSVN